MKKIFFSTIWLLLGLGMAWAQNPISIVTMSLNQQTEYRLLGNSATLLLQNAEGLKLNDLLLLTENLNDTVRMEASNETYTYTYTYTNWDENGEEYEATGTGYGKTRDTIKSDRKYIASIPAEFYFGEKRMKRAGITADGMVFFSEGDSIRPHSDKWDGESIYKLSQRGIYNYIYFALLNVKEISSYMGWDYETNQAVTISDPNMDETQPTPLFATDNTRIGYEVDGDMLYIGYENILMTSGFEPETHNQTVSWNYQINLKTGEVGLQTKGFFRDTEKDLLLVNMKWGLVTEDQNNTAWLKDFEGISEILPGMSSLAVRMGKNELDDSFGRPEENAVYQFTLPAPCAAVENAEITWGDIYITQDKINVTSNTVWTKGEKALFVLSKHETLENDNLPVDGKTYESDATFPKPVQLGDGQAIVAKMLTGRNDISDNFSHFSSLDAATTYYIHTFVFNTACSNGPVYGTALPAKKITTSLGKPDAISIEDITTNSLKVVLPQAEDGFSYILALSTSPLARPNGTPFAGLLKNGTTYSEGEVLRSDNEFADPFTIAKIGVTGTVELTGLDAGTGYYVVAWMMQGQNEETLYSSDYTKSTARTHYTLPTNITFVGEAVSSLPIGWESSGRMVQMWDETTMQPVETFSPHFKVQFTTLTGGEIFSTTLEENDRNEETGLISAYAITPWINKDDAQSILSTFKIRHYSMIGEGFQQYTVREGDSVIFSYQEAGSEEWNRIAFCNYQTDYDANGAAELEFPLFQPQNDFRYRIDYYHESSADDPTYAFFAIYSIKAAASSGLPAVTDLQAEDITKESATITWKGEADGYRLLWKERAEEGDYDTIATTQTSYSLTGLKENTEYAYCVYGIYGTDNGSLSQVMYFTTLGDEVATVSTPTFSVAAGKVEKGTEVSLSCATADAEIYYTLDGSTPSSQATLYEKAIVIDSTVTIKAIAVKEGMTDSKVAEATYTVTTANQNGILAQVKMYPNPTDGIFHIVVPETATVEVFATNGTLVKRLDIAAGTTALQLNNAGIYFVKVTVNGQVGIQKMIVR